jgi:hypothetical protein
MSGSGCRWAALVARTPLLRAPDPGRDTTPGIFFPASLSLSRPSRHATPHHTTPPRVTHRRSCHTRPAAGHATQAGVQRGKAAGPPVTGNVCLRVKAWIRGCVARQRRGCRAGEWVDAPDLRHSRSARGVLLLRLRPTPDRLRLLGVPVAALPIAALRSAMTPSQSLCTANERSE